jgi:hypothetical protein
MTHDEFRILAQGFTVETSGGARLKPGVQAMLSWAGGDTLWLKTGRKMGYGFDRAQSFNGSDHLNAELGDLLASGEVAKSC